MEIRSQETSSSRKWLILISISLALLPVTIDTTILYVAIPTLTLNLKANAEEVLWIIDIYPLLMAGLLVVASALGGRMGYKKALMIGVTIFGAASALAAFSQTPIQLILMRALLAVGGALILPATLAIVRSAFQDKRERILALGIWTSIAAGGSAIGPVVGGAILEKWWWGAAFLVNLPIAIIALLLALAFLPKGEKQKAAPWTALDVICSIAGMIAIVYGIKSFIHPDKSTEASIIGFTLGSGLLIYFISRQLNSPTPLINLKLFNNHAIKISTLAIFTAFMAMTGFEVILSQHLQFAYNLTPLQSGLAIIVLPIGTIIASPFTSFLTRGLSTHATLVTALAISATGFAGASYLYEPGFHSLTQWITSQLSLLCIGIGTGIVITTASSAIMESVPSDDASAAASIESVTLELSSGLGVAIVGSIAAILFQQFVSGDAALGSLMGHSIGDTIINLRETGEAETGNLMKLSRQASAFAYKEITELLAVTLAIVATATFVLSLER
ncbi:TPA: MFS transporter [Pseudomonas aeruginosa]|nr:MFS transporter [Pseudomonas aeruginosa]HEE6759660.1 MFS transporter [Pseudomonas aeruginosa]